MASLQVYPLVLLSKAKHCSGGEKKWPPTLWVRLTAIFFGVIRAIASGVIPSTCSCTRAESTMSSRPAVHKHKHFNTTSLSSLEAMDWGGRAISLSYIYIFTLTHWVLMVRSEQKQITVSPLWDLLCLFAWLCKPWILILLFLEKTELPSLN